MPSRHLIRLIGRLLSEWGEGTVPEQLHLGSLVSSRSIRGLTAPARRETVEFSSLRARSAMLIVSKACSREKLHIDARSFPGHKIRADFAEHAGELEAVP